MDPNLLHPSSSASNRPTIGYRLQKDEPGPFIWEGHGRREIPLRSTVPNEVVHIGETTQFSIPNGLGWEAAVINRYSDAYLLRNGLSAPIPMRQPGTKPELLTWQSAEIQAFMTSNTHRPGQAPVANISGR